VRTLLEILLLFVASVLASFGLWHWSTSRTTLVMGTAVDVVTGKPVPNASIRFRALNFSFGRFVTDAKGRFSARNVPADDFYVLWVDHPHYAGMLRTTIGTSLPLYRPGEQERGVVVPAIPGGEISGRVFDETETRVSACRVSAFVPLHATGPVILERWRDTKTDRNGVYRFANLDADRYYVLALCDKLLPGEKQYGPVTSTDWRQRPSWQHVFYPDARTVRDAQPLVILPGTKKTGINFHLHIVQAFSVRGRIIRARNEKPVSTAFYINDLSMSSTDRASKPFSWEPGCQWNVFSGTFRCDFVTPGSYRLHMDVVTGWTGTQAAVRRQNGHVVDLSNPQTGILDVKIGPEPPPELQLQLHKLDPWTRSNNEAPAGASKAQDGTVQVQMNCKARSSMSPTLLYIFPVPQIPDTRLVGNRYYSCATPAIQQKPAGTYFIAACRSDFWRPRPAFLEVIKMHAAKVVAPAGRKTVVSVPVFKGKDIYHMVVDYLHTATLTAN